MGYDVHITRAHDWTASAQRPITRAEWETAAHEDPELDMTGAAEAATAGGTLRYESDGLAVWHAHPAGEQVWFDWREGRVVAKNADETTIAKMVALAARLGARVVGDDGETYGADGAVAAPAAAAPGAGQGLFSWLRGLLGRLRPPSPAEPPPFGAGDRVRDDLGQRGRVISIDLSANHGLGRIVVRYDDGRQLTMAAAAHGLTRDEE